MYSRRNHFQSEFPSRLRNSLQTSIKLISSSSSTPELLKARPVGRDSELVSINQERLSFCDNDLLDIDPEDISEALSYCPYPQLGPQSPISPPSGVLEDARTFLSRSRSSLARIKSLSKKPPKYHSQRGPRQPRKIPDSDTSASIDGAALILAFPRPLTSVHSAHEASSQDERSLSSETALVDDSCSVLSHSDPFRLVESPTDCWTSTKLRPFSILRIVREDRIDPNTIAPSPPNSCVATPCTIIPSVALSSAAPLNPFRKTLKRLKTFRKGNFFNRNPVPEVCQIFPNPATDNEAHTPASEPILFLPELSFDSTPLSLLIHEDYTAEQTSVVSHEEDHETLNPSPCPSLARNINTDPVPNLPLIKYDRVDPCELTDSPPIFSSLDFSPAATPLLSPSWLSRNIRDYEFAAFGHTVEVTPPSPFPLPILPRSLLPVLSPSASPSDHLTSEPSPSSVNGPNTSRSSTSSVTLYSNTKRLSYLSVSSGRSRPPSVNRLSILQYHTSVAENRRSIQSFITCASIAFSDHAVEQEAFVNEEPSKPRFFLLLHPPSPPDHSTELPPDSAHPSLSPLELFDTTNPLSRLPDQTITPRLILQEQPLPISEIYQVFIPPPNAYGDNDRFPLPNYLRALIKSFFRNSKEILVMPQTVYGKQADTVDWGDEVDYSGYEWFKDPPPRPEPPTPQPATDPYVPPPGVIEQNEMFDYALRSAPNVLYGRFKQYGQLGVLAWCSEFSEMIDALKNLGFEGNMFVSTRVQALKTCEEILKLDLQIEMQIIVMYLSSQVARLRRFLDADRQFDDYPKPNFPTEFPPGA